MKKRSGVSKVVFTFVAWLLFTPLAFAGKYALKEAAALVTEVAGPASLLLLGEVHGNAQTPALVARLSEQFSASAPVRLGLEIYVDEQPRIDAYLASNGSGKARGELLAGPFWTREYQDGRSSRAMFELLESICRLRAAGRDIGVFAFDGAWPAAHNRDEAMARWLRKRIGEAGNARILVLAGNYHTRLNRGTPWDPGLALMGSYLIDLKPISIDVRPSSGTSWVCQEKSCGILQLGSFDPHYTKMEYIPGDITKTGAHGMLKLPRVKASPPMIKRLRSVKDG